MDPCAALHVKFDLLSGAEKEIIFQIGNEIEYPGNDCFVTKIYG